MKATVVYRCLKVINQLRENKSGLQTKTEVITSTVRGKQRKNRNTEVPTKNQNDNTTHTETNYKITTQIAPSQKVEKSNQI